MARVDISDSGKIQDIAMASEEKKEVKKEAKTKKKEGKREKKRERKEHESDMPPTADEASGENVALNEERDNDGESAPPSLEKADEKKEKSKEERRLERTRKKAAKKDEKSSLLDKVPKTDEHGISYTKIQIRRMSRRVKRGLPPVPTEAEEQERLREIKKEKALEEEELSGLIFDRTNGAEAGESGEDEVVGVDEDSAENGNVEDKGTTNAESGVCRPVKKKKTNKPVPSDYVCQACKNKHTPPHWIYDCPDKVCKPGSNQIKKNKKGVNPPDPRKVYVSGMPFGVKQREVKTFFEQTSNCGKIQKCHLVTFKDEFKRCKGEAFLTFETEEGAKKAISVSGETMAIDEKKDKGETKEGNNGSEKKELLLKVTKVVNKITERRRNRYFSQRRTG